MRLLWLNISKKFLQCTMWFNAEWFWSKLHPNWLFVSNGKIQLKKLMKFTYFMVKDNFYNLLSYFLYFTINKFSLQSLKFLIRCSLLYFCLYAQVQDFFLYRGKTTTLWNIQVAKHHINLLLVLKPLFNNSMSWQLFVLSFRPQHCLVIDRL